LAITNPLAWPRQTKRRWRADDDPARSCAGVFGFTRIGQSARSGSVPTRLVRQAVGPDG
jgi:hypothetical protein